MVIYRDVGDSLEAERIACQCRKIQSNNLIRGSGAHRATQIILSKYAYCVIEKPLIRTS